MSTEEAKKTISEEGVLAPVKNYAKLDFKYTALVLPYDDAIKVMQYLRSAEEWDTTDYSHPVICPIKEKVSMELLSQKQYVEKKMAHLLGINIGVGG